MQPGDALPTFADLRRRAQAALNPRRLSRFAEAGGVAAALLAEDGVVYTGICVDTASSMGFCAEHAAAAAMLGAGSNRVLRMIALDWTGRVLPPCGRCREFIRELHPDNFLTKVQVDDQLVVPLRDLLPHPWTPREKD